MLRLMHGDRKGRKKLKQNEFHTLKGYQLIADEGFTPAMEDYLEMICRILGENGNVRARELSECLNVKPSSTSKMVRHLHMTGYLSAEKYGIISLTEKGKAAGNYLLYRHDVIHKFLCFLNGTESELEETEKIEHFLSRKTVQNMDRLLREGTKTLPKT